MILKPSNLSPNNSTFTASESINISWKNNGDTMVAYEIIVEDNSTSATAYASGRVESYSPNHSIPNNTLVNGTTYKYKVIVYNSIDESSTSDYKIFKCNTRPAVTILGDGIVRNQILSVQALYNQSEGVSLKCYKFSLFDEYDNLLEQSDYIYDNNLTHTFTYILQEDTTYKVSCLAISQNDLSGISTLVFVTDYITPAVQISLVADTPFGQPYVNLQWTTVRIIGKSLNDEPINYINTDKADLNNKTVYFNEGFNLNGNFTIRLWVEDLQTDVEIFKIIGSNGSISIQYENNKIHVYKTISVNKYHYATSELSETSGSQIYICLQQNNNQINVFYEVI